MIIFNQRINISDSLSIIDHLTIVAAHNLFKIRVIHIDTHSIHISDAMTVLIVIISVHCVAHCKKQTGHIKHVPLGCHVLRPQKDWAENF